MFVSHVQHQDCARTVVFLAHTLNGELEDRKDQFAEFDQNCMALES